MTPSTYGVKYVLTSHFLCCCSSFHLFIYFFAVGKGIVELSNDVVLKCVCRMKNSRWAVSSCAFYQLELRFLSLTRLKWVFM